MDKSFIVKGIHFDYGQPSCDGERNAIEAIAHFYGISIVNSELIPAIKAEINGEYFGRNMLIILSALNYFTITKGIIALGIHKGTNYYDSSSRFLSQMQSLLDGYYGGTIKLDTPFINFAKNDIFEYCRKNSVPVDLTYSCERNATRPCGVCLSCLDRKTYDISQ